MRSNPAFLALLVVLVISATPACRALAGDGEPTVVTEPAGEGAVGGAPGAAAAAAGAPVEPQQPADEEAGSRAAEPERIAREVQGEPAWREAVDVDAYPWLEDFGDGLPAMQTLHERFPAPSGFARVSVEERSYARWLRGLPVYDDRKQVLAFDGSPIRAPSAAVVVLDVGDRDVQQCADTIIRLHAEYRWHAGDPDGIGYHFTSGDLSRWEDWRKGERFRVKGREVERVGGGAKGSSHAAFRKYLQHLFTYAGTRSMKFDADPVPVDEPLQAGDFFNQAGGPGHAVVVLDVAESPDGRRAALLGQGFMPAQELHVLTRRGDDVLDGVWFVLPGAGEALDTPSWAPFGRDQAWRFK